MREGFHTGAALLLPQASAAIKMGVERIVVSWAVWGGVAALRERLTGVMRGAALISRRE